MGHCVVNDEVVSEADMMFGLDRARERDADPSDGDRRSRRARSATGRASRAVLRHRRGRELGDGCRLQHHVTHRGPERGSGADNVFYAFASIGQQTQDLKYSGEPTYLEIGDGNTFREFVTVHRGDRAGRA